LLVADFEADTVGTTYPVSYYGWPKTGVNGSVVASTDLFTSADGTKGAGTGDSSTKVLAVPADNYDEYVVLPVTLPNGAVLSDYAYLHVRAVFPPNGSDNENKKIFVFAGNMGSDGRPLSGATLLNSGGSGGGIPIGASALTGGMSTAWTEFLIPISASPSISSTGLQIALGISRGGVGASGATTAYPYYLDDIALIQ
jgi:hypothetical protein